ncbi:F-box/kelch-repeat protein At3g23880-like [Andrographis paniculata]|uniref:F-box/kelch-repeat protein At3g23880-like n=1 Tax=Andrographis paniculata TaxID=175694 RepID=UPI0021E70609|nr:F-box/kelch-repeat protein At3g23880-like [Andrographis paniculata]
MTTGSSSKRASTELSDFPTGDSVTLPNLPDEIIAEILPWLPVKSLLKFRCVSKSWRSLISTTEFIKTHLKISTKSNVGCHNRLLIGSGRPLPTNFHTFVLNPRIDDERNSLSDTLVLDYNSCDSIRIIGSCNGLVCVVLDDYTIVLWNPATRKSKKLPFSYPDTLWSVYGFGYAESTDDYKVMEICSVCNHLDEYETRVNVYSWRRNSWRDMEWSGGAAVAAENNPGVFVNGAIHWLTCSDHWGLIVFDVATGACSSVELPRHRNEDVEHVMLGVVSGGGLLCASFDYGSYMDVWVMGEYGAQESWTKLACLSYYLLLRRHRHLVRPKLLFVAENGGVLLSLGSDLILYKPPNSHEVYSIGSGAEVEGVTYSESLLSPEFG